VKQDSIMRHRSNANVTVGALRSINLGALDVLPRVSSTLCTECHRPIRWWNRRIWLVDGESCAHAHCWEGKLFLKAFVADEVRRSRLMADEIRHRRVMADDIPPPRQRQFNRTDSSVHNELKGAGESARLPSEVVERVTAQLQQRTPEPILLTDEVNESNCSPSDLSTAEQVAPEPCLDKNQP
jgi:hypothetical protein